MTDSKIDDGGPAFPVEKPIGFGGQSFAKGMSLRDWFAGQAAAAISGTSCATEAAADNFGKAAAAADASPPELVAAMAYKLADAMLIERSKQRST